MKERKIVMLNHPTLDQMQALGLAGMAAAYRQLAEQNNAADLSRDEWLGLMLDREAAMRADKRLTNRLAAAKLRFVATGTMFFVAFGMALAAQFALRKGTQTAGPVLTPQVNA